MINDQWCQWSMSVCQCQCCQCLTMDWIESQSDWFSVGMAKPKDYGNYGMTHDSVSGSAIMYCVSCVVLCPCSGGHQVWQRRQPSQVSQIHCSGEPAVRQWPVATNSKQPTAITKNIQVKVQIQIKNNQIIDWLTDSFTDDNFSWSVFDSINWYYPAWWTCRGCGTSSTACRGNTESDSDR